MLGASKAVDFAECHAASSQSATNRMAALPWGDVDDMMTVARGELSGFLKQVSHLSFSSFKGSAQCAAWLAISGGRPTKICRVSLGNWTNAQQKTLQY
eukprot:scaffold40644_cov29-Prasinocladus_malaysianus.AAC.2